MALGEELPDLAWIEAQGAELEGLLLHLDEYSSCFDRALEVVARLPKLRYVAISRALPLAHDEWVPGRKYELTDKPRWAAELGKMASQVAVASATVQYIKVCWLAWHVGRAADNALVQLEPLDQVEQEGIEIFQPPGGRWLTASLQSDSVFGETLCY